MNLKSSMSCTLLCSVTTLLMQGEVIAGNHTACEKTAHLMHQACYVDARDNFITTQANCTNLQSRTEQAFCREQAKHALREKDETCREQFKARYDACRVLDENRYDIDPLTDPSITFVNPNEVDKSRANPYISVVAGHTYVLRAGDEGEETVVVHVTDEIREIQGVACRVIVDAVVVAGEDEATGRIEYEPIEITDDWLAQDTESNIYYCGELARNFEEGVLVNLDGSFESGRDSAKAGVLIRAIPAVGSAHRQEFSLGEAEDIIQYLDLASLPNTDNERFPCAEAGGCLQTYEFAPLEPDTAEIKYYLPNIGFVFSEHMENGALIEGGDQLLCVGDSLDILESPDCEIENPAELLDELCDLAPDAFCH